jgi:hypothetical protein
LFVSGLVSTTIEEDPLGPTGEFPNPVLMAKEMVSEQRIRFRISSHAMLFFVFSEAFSPRATRT